MRAIFFSFLLVLFTADIFAQSVFDTASCGGVSQLTGFSADKIFDRSQLWINQNIQPLTYTENKTIGTIIVTALEPYNAKTTDKLPERFSGNFEYTFQVAAKDGYYSYDFVNVKYIPAAKMKEMRENPEENNPNVRIKKKTWEKISKSAYNQLQAKGKQYDTFMQNCKVE